MGIDILCYVYNWLTISLRIMSFVGIAILLCSMSKGILGSFFHPGYIKIYSKYRLRIAICSGYNDHFEPV